jgi:hypothetical protein
MRGYYCRAEKDVKLKIKLWPLSSFISFPPFHIKDGQVDASHLPAS